MAVLPTTKRISKEDIKGSPPWFDPFLGQVNTFFSAVYDALNGQVTFVDNISAFEKELTFITSATYSGGDWNNLSVENTLRRKASSVSILQILQKTSSYTPIKEAVYLDWIELNGSIVIGFITGLANSTTYNLKLRVT